MEIELDLSWPRYCVITVILRTYGAVPNTNPLRYQVTSQATGATFQIIILNFMYLFATFSINDNIKFLENIKQEFKRTISWNKNRFAITTQTKKQ